MVSLLFIDHSAAGIGTPDRRTIRSHVMKGKNAGRPRPSRRKVKSIPPKQRFLTANGRPIFVTGRSLSRPLLWNDLCLTTFPEELDAESMGVLRRWFFDISDELFPPKFCFKFDIIKSVWVNCILVDEAYFHSTLAISASYVNFHERKPGISAKTLHHTSKACGLVNTKLSGPESVSDSALAAVVTLAIYQQVHYQFSTALIHLSGLYRMIQLRGGVAKLMGENRPLALKALRLDVELALQHGSALMFDFETVTSLDIVRGDSMVDAQYHDTDSGGPSLMFRVFKFTSMLNNSAREDQPKLKPLDYTEMFISLLYGLLQASSPSPSSPGSQVDDVSQLAHLAMLSLLTSLLPEYGRENSRYPLLSERLEDAILRLCLSSGDGGDVHYIFPSSLLLWALFIGGITVLKPANCPWVSTLISANWYHLNPKSWSDIHEQLRQFP